MFIWRGLKLVVFLIGLGTIWLLLAPGVAGFLGWALPYPTRLPSTVHFRGRDYISPTGCLARQQTPLRGGTAERIGSVPMLFGSSLPILERRTRAAPANVPEVGIIVLRSPGCYVTYGLSGGP